MAKDFGKTKNCTHLNPFSPALCVALGLFERNRRKSFSKKGKQNEIETGRQDIRESGKGNKGDFIINIPLVCHPSSFFCFSLFFSFSYMLFQNISSLPFLKVTRGQHGEPPLQCIFFLLNRYFREAVEAARVLGANSSF